MLKLMKLELKKFKIGGYIKAAIIANFVIFGFLVMLSFISNIEQDIIFEDYEMAIMVIDTFVRGTFIVFAAVLLVRFVISEYNSKSITVLFMYPIKRKKLILAKLLIVVIFTFLCIVLSNIVLNIGFYLFNSYFPNVGYYINNQSFTAYSATLTPDFILTQTITMLMSSFAASVMSLIPLYFGMRKFSGVATIVSSLLVVMIVCQNIDGFSLNSIILVPLTLALMGAWVAYSAIQNIDKRDVLN